MLKKFIFSGINIKSPLANIGILITRVFVGLSMAFAHGQVKIPPSEGFIAVISRLNFPMPEFFAWMTVVAEFGGGLLIAVGLATRPSAVLLFITMFVAAFMQHAGDVFAKKELSLLYLAFAVLFFSIGAGKYSIDKLIRK